MSRKITVILKNGAELAYKDARVLARMFHEFTPWRGCDRGYGRPSGLEGNRTRIYQGCKNEQPEKLLTLIDPNHIQRLHAEGD